jgi:putative serine protease PepD
VSENNPWWVPLRKDEAEHQIFTPQKIRSYEEDSSNRASIYLVIAALLAGVLGGFFGNFFYTKLTSVTIKSATSVVERAPNSIASLAAKVSPAVVSINVATQVGGDTGSGFFLSSDGYILTNNHVVVAAANGGGVITVDLPSGKSYAAKLIGRDSSYDLAVIKIPVTGAPVLPLGNSDQVLVGDPVIAVGSPLALAGTVTSGIISAKNRAVSAGEGNGVNSYIDALQTDAAINPGNSGGPLIDQGGNVIGINSAIASVDNSEFSAPIGGQSGSIGIGFAIPINEAKNIASQLIKNGYAVHPILGIEIDSANPNQAIVANVPGAVSPNGPAARAGIRPGDQITQIDGVTLNSADQLIVLVRAHHVGDKVVLAIKRGNQTFSVNVILGSARS